jgi:Rrf2 family protein
MLLPQTAEYALRAVIFLARHQERAIRVGEMAAEIGVPQNYLSKTMHQLARAGILRSMRGPTGGFQLGIPAGELTLDKVVAPFIASGERRCLLGQGVCGQRPDCPVHERWLPVARQLDAFFTNTSVGQLAEHVPAGGSQDAPLSLSVLLSHVTGE